MTTKEAAEYLGITQSLVRRRIRENELPAERESTPRGDVLYIKQGELEAYHERLKAQNREAQEQRRPGRRRKV